MDSLRSAIEVGRPWPLGAHADGDGVNFAVFSAHALEVELCLFDASGMRELSRTALPARTHDVWHGRVPGLHAGQVYGLRVRGPWKPEHGHRFNPYKLLLDPYAREIVGRFDWRGDPFGFDPRHPHVIDMHDNAAHALKARVVHDEFDWGDDKHLHTPLAETVLYEVHVKGYSQLHPGVPEALRGSYAGLASPASIAHLKGLGITAVSLLPVHQRVDEQRLVRLGLTNYWGYNTIGFFCPDPRLASGGGDLSARDEFRTMVKQLHAAGIEVILDVVYNHTAESDEHGPTISFRGLDNTSYYRLPPDNPALYENHAGCGNVLDIRQPAVLKLVMDSLRYWAGEMHVDGFRFDLAPVLGRGDHGFDANGPFFAAVAQDPLLSRLKMIAEPWDIGPGGYQVGSFPTGWLEWNDQFRDTMRGFWVTAAGSRGTFAQRLCASSDTFRRRGRAPSASVNFVVAHDGFCLHDLVSFEQRHNLANGEGNRDGHGHNLSWNCGVEGPTPHDTVNALRGRIKRALIATTLLAQGTPMLAAGDELGHSQGGNNNPYCQDNPTTWIDWAAADADLIAFTARVLALRRQALPLDGRWYDGLPDTGAGASTLSDLAWLDSDGSPMVDDDWRNADARVLGCLIGRPGKARVPMLLLFNGGSLEMQFRLPAGDWQAVLDTSDTRGQTTWRGSGGTSCPLAARSLLLLSDGPLGPAGR
jgi:glycogen debranching enzyme GlgX